METPTADSAAEPDISHENPAARSTWFGHPRQLARLFTTEMWERFGYYGMRALLTLYLTKHFIFGDREATGLYGGFTALVYPVSYTHLRAHETGRNLVCRLLLEK